MQKAWLKKVELSLSTCIKKLFRKQSKSFYIINELNDYYQTDISKFHKVSYTLRSIYVFL